MSRRRQQEQQPAKAVVEKSKEQGQLINLKECLEGKIKAEMKSTIHHFMRIPPHKKIFCRSVHKDFKPLWSMDSITYVRKETTKLASLSKEYAPPAAVFLTIIAGVFYLGAQFSSLKADKSVLESRISSLENELHVKLAAAEKVAAVHQDNLEDKLAAAEGNLQDKLAAADKVSTAEKAELEAKIKLAENRKGLLSYIFS